MQRILENTRFLQIFLLVLFGVCIAQVVYWTVDQIDYVAHSTDRAARLFEADRRAAERMLADGEPAADMLAVFPHLEVVENAAAEDGADAPGSVIVGSGAKRTLHGERTSRTNRYRWESVFLVVTLLLGAAVLLRAVRHDHELRRRQQNFLASVTHEIKSPVASLRLAAETMELRDPPAERRTQLVGRMLEDLDRLERTVYHFLDAAAIDEGRAPYERESVDLGTLVEAEVERLRRRAGEERVTISAEVGGQPIASADPRAVRTIVKNILDNAIQAAAPGHGEVRARAEVDGEWAVVEVRDTGVGFDAHDGKRLFDKFYRSGDELRRTSKGTGLGLYLVRELVHLGGGRVDAESGGPGQGARFRVRWPLASEGSA